MPGTAVVTGTSPIMLCAAIRLAEGGWQVRAIEEKDRPGGAWRTIEAFGFERVEPAVHLLENRRRTYRYLSQNMGVDLEDEERCLGVLHGHRIGFHVTRVACFAGVGLRGLSRGDSNRTRLGLRSAMRSSCSVTTPFKYPKGGSASLMDRLLQRASRLPIEFQFDTAINEVLVDPDRGHHGICRSSRGDQPFDRLIVSSRAHARILVRGSRLQIPARRSTVKSFLMLVHEPDAPRFSYIEVLADDLIRRVRDVGRFTRPRPTEGSMIICIQLREKHSATEGRLSTLAECVLNRLQRLRILGNKAEVVDHKMEYFTHDTVPDATIRNVGGLTGSMVTGLTTTDFAEDLANLLERPATSWKGQA